MPPNATGVIITNPLVLYRSLVATNRIKADPAQHRLGKLVTSTILTMCIRTKLEVQLLVN